MHWFIGKIVKNITIILSKFDAKSYFEWLLQSQKYSTAWIEFLIRAHICKTGVDVEIEHLKYLDCWW